MTYIICILIFAIGNITPTQTVYQMPNTAPTKDSIHMEFFHGNGCPQCDRVKPVVASLKKKYSQLEVKEYEIYDNRDNLLLLQKRFRQLDIPFRHQCVPAVFIGDLCFTGYKDIKNKLEDAIQERLVAPQQ